MWGELDALDESERANQDAPWCWRRLHGGVTGVREASLGEWNDLVLLVESFCTAAAGKEQSRFMHWPPHTRALRRFWSGRETLSSEKTYLWEWHVAGVAGVWLNY